jgi:hypothetical protein
LRPWYLVYSPWSAKPAIRPYQQIDAEPIASMKADALADAMAPTLQRYLVGNIS